MYRVAVIYKKPLNRSDLDGDVDSVLRQLKGQFLRRLRVKLQQTHFSRAAKVALSQAMKIEVKKSSIVLTVHHPAWRPLVEGQKSQPMFWLKKAKGPIPIITEKGKLIFRSATPKSFANGKWIHPGRASSNFVEKARREARDWIKRDVSKFVGRKIASSWQSK